MIKRKLLAFLTQVKQKTHTPHKPASRMADDDMNFESRLGYGSLMASQSVTGAHI
jgi:hypothetical protein